LNPECLCKFIGQQTQGNPVENMNEGTENTRIRKSEKIKRFKVVALKYSMPVKSAYKNLKQRFFNQISTFSFQIFAGYVQQY
jgi:hypothetical protein